jgi:hypothetical protein
MAIFTFLVQKGVLIKTVITKKKAPSVRHQAYLTIGNFKKSPGPRDVCVVYAYCCGGMGPHTLAECGVKYLGPTNQPMIGTFNSSRFATA